MSDHHLEEPIFPHRSLFDLENEEEQPGMLSLLRQRNIALFWCASFISIIGDWMLRIALPIYVFQITGSALATGAMFMASTIPQILFSSVAGVFVDRWDRKRTLVVTNMLLGMTLLMVLVVRSIEWLWVIYLVAFLQSTISQFFAPAENAFLPYLVDKEQLLQLNTLNSLTFELARLIGPVLGGLAATQIGLLNVALLDAISFFIASALLALVRVDTKASQVDAPPQDNVARSLRRVWHELIEGLRLVRSERRISILFLVMAVMALGGGFFPVLFTPFLSEVLRGDAQTYGWLMSAHAVGGLLGGVLIGRIGTLLPTYSILGWGDILFGVIGVMIFNAPTLFPQAGLTIALVLMFVSGIPSISALTSLRTLVQKNTVDEYRGRIFGVYSTLFSTAGLVGMGLASVLGGIIGTAQALSLHGGIYILAGVIALFFLGQSYAKVEVAAIVPQD